MMTATRNMPGMAGSMLFPNLGRACASILLPYCQPPINTCADAWPHAQPHSFDLGCCFPCTVLYGSQHAVNVFLDFGKPFLPPTTALLFLMQRACHQAVVLACQVAASLCRHVGKGTCALRRCVACGMAHTACGFLRFCECTNSTH